MISFVIPAYNASAYLDRAINSIVADGNNNDKFEIIIVENGSTDNTTEIAEKFVQLYSNIHLFHSEKGVSNARNYGIKHAKGEWIFFVDADDYLTAEALAVLLKDAETKKYDLFLYGHEAGTTPKVVTDQIQGEVYHDGDVKRIRIAMLENPTKYMQVWAKLFKRELIMENEILFDDCLRLSEDSDFTLQYSRVCKNIFVSPSITYHYSIDNVSTMRGSNGDKTKDYVFAMERTLERIKNEDKCILQAFQKYILMHLNIALVRDVFEASNIASFKEKKAQMKDIANEAVFANAISEVKVRESLSLRMIPILCLKYHLYVISGLVYALRAYMNKRRENQ